TLRRSYLLNPLPELPLVPTSPSDPSDVSFLLGNSFRPPVGRLSSPSPNILQFYGYSTQISLLTKRNTQLRPFNLYSPLSAGGPAETGQIITEHASRPRNRRDIGNPLPRSRAPLAQACCLAGQPTVTMASLIPLINDLIPMIVPSSVSVTKATTLRPPNATLNPASANEADAVVSKSDKLCASGSSRACHDSINPVPSHGLVSCSLPRLLQLTRVVITLNPHATSAIRHHGEQG
ncbi:cupin domain-containing protein, partial [Colletotrichum cuscutae]